jgi:hypothetical protein
MLVPLAVIALGLAIFEAARSSLGVAGWAGLFFVILQIWLVFAIGVLAIYVARIYKDQVGLPLYVVDKARSFLEEHDDRPT